MTPRIMITITTVAPRQIRSCDVGYLRTQVFDHHEPHEICHIFLISLMFQVSLLFGWLNPAGFAAEKLDKTGHLGTNPIEPPCNPEKIKVIVHYN